MAFLLVADDDPGVQKLLEITFEIEGHRVAVAGDGLEALEVVRTQSLDAVILDVMMPGMDGIDVCRAVKSDPATADIPIVMLSARAQEADIAVGRQAGAQAYVTKPFDPAELVRTVEFVLAQTGRK